MTQIVDEAARKRLFAHGETRDQWEAHVLDLAYLAMTSDEPRPYEGACVIPVLPSTPWPCLVMRRRGAALKPITPPEPPRIEWRAP